MELAPIKELLKRRRKLVKDLEPLPVDETWSADEEAFSKRITVRMIADIDAEIAERTGSPPPVTSSAGGDDSPPGTRPAILDLPQ